MMNEARHERGFSLVELMISMLVLLAIMAGLFGMLIENSRINKSKRMTMER